MGRSSRHRPELPAGTQAVLGVRVANLGTSAWGHAAIVDDGSGASDGNAPAQAATLVARWIALSGAAVPGLGTGAGTGADVIATDLPIGLEPGATADVALALTVPATPGEYLLLLDIVTPADGSLIASGADPTLVRITVVAATP